jgi:hypothetical protein
MATTETFSPDADTHILQTSVDANLGTYVYMYAMSYSPDKNRRSLIHFDVSSLPSDATIESAKLYLCIWSAYETTNGMYRMTGDWTESGVTWSTLPSYEATPTDSASIVTTAGAWIEWDVTTDVQAFVDGTPNFGWLIMDTIESQNPPVYAKYYSREYADSALRPYLEVTYTEGGATAPTADFTADVTLGDAPLTVQFTDASTGDGITDWAWDFDNDGTVDSNDQNPACTYDAAGTYTVSLTVTNEAGSDDEVKEEYICVNEGASPVTEFPTLALPAALVIGILGVAFGLQRRGVQGRK